MMLSFNTDQDLDLEIRRYNTERKGGQYFLLGLQFFRQNMGTTEQ
jgi:hypothetical protein